MKRIALLFVLGIFLLSGCNQEIIYHEGERDVIIFFTAKSLSASLLKSDASEDEKYFEDILVFGIDETDNVVQTFIPILDGLSLSDRIVLENVSKNVKSFYAIANPSEDMKEMPYPTNVLDLLDMTCDFSTLPTSPFIMSGIGNIISGYVTQIELVRIVAKIEITALNDLEIETITVNNISDKGYVFKMGALSIPENSMTVYHEIAPFTPTRAIFYVTENSMDTPAKFVITGKFDGKQVEYEFEFTRNGDNINIERNKHYRVDVTPITQSEGKITITIPDWEDVAADGKIIPKPEIQENPFKNGVKILAIGNSYSEDCLRYVVPLLMQLGVPQNNIKIVSSWIPEGTLAVYAAYINSNTVPNPHRLLFFENGWADWNVSSDQQSNLTLQQILIEDEWDIITLQQPDPNPYLWGATELANFNTVVDYVHTHARKSSNFKFGWHMTWSYDQSFFDLYWEEGLKWFFYPDEDKLSDPQKMYEVICDVVQNKMPQDVFDFVVPTATAIQNARNLLGNILNQYDAHLSGLGCYLASATWVKTITGLDISGLQTPYNAYQSYNDYPEYDGDPGPVTTIDAARLAQIVQIVNATMAKPFETSF